MPGAWKYHVQNVCSCIYVWITVSGINYLWICASAISEDIHLERRHRVFISFLFEKCLYTLFLVFLTNTSMFTHSSAHIIGFLPSQLSQISCHQGKLKSFFLIFHFPFIHFVFISKSAKFVRNNFITYFYFFFFCFSQRCISCCFAWSVNDVTPPICYLRR